MLLLKGFSIAQPLLPPLETEGNNLATPEENDTSRKSAWLISLEEVYPQWLVFMDEMGANISYSLPCMRGRAATSKCTARFPANVRFPATVGRTPPSSQHEYAEGMGQALAVEGAIIAAIFEVYIGEVLAPKLQPGQVVFMENLWTHKGECMHEPGEARAMNSTVPASSYSPELDPIEEAFSKLKGILRKAQAKSRETSIEAIMGRALDVITLQDARGFFEHCGYRLWGQLLCASL